MSSFEEFINSIVVKSDNELDYSEKTILTTFNKYLLNNLFVDNKEKQINLDTIMEKIKLQFSMPNKNYYM